jgi:hypothetical protein
LLVEDTRPDQLLKKYPAFAVAFIVTFDPATYHGPVGTGVTVPPPDGFTAVVIWYCVCHVHVMVEFCVMVNVTVVAVPEAGTDPVPVHPVHT